VKTTTRSQVKSPVNHVLIGLGSSIGDRLRHLAQALELLAHQLGAAVAISSIYETEPLGGVAKNRFLNGAAMFVTELAPLDTLAILHQVEDRLGRNRTQKWQDRPIDLDILLVRDQSGVCIVSNSSHLQIPHPAMLDRDFVLVPAAEIAPDWLHPLSGKTLLAENQNRGYRLSTVQPMT
jgi:2-amino-4-hydroxy-6-hydroxymethyldihydropteridine diphosphokinase